MVNGKIISSDSSDYKKLVKGAIISSNSGDARLVILKEQLAKNFVQLYSGAVIEIENQDGVEMEVYIDSFVEYKKQVICRFNET